MRLSRKRGSSAWSDEVDSDGDEAAMEAAGAPAEGLLREAIAAACEAEWACFTLGRVSGYERFFRSYISIDEIAGHLRSRCAWICVCRLQRRTLRMSQGAPLKSAVTGRSRLRMQVPLVRRMPDGLATGDGGPMSVVRHRSRESNRSRVTE